MSLTSSYDTSRWRLTVLLDGKKYVYKEVSPFHNRTFEGKRKNIGKAMAYIRTFPLLDRCPVCGKDHLDWDDICSVCGWQQDTMVQTPDKCSGGPNYAPLSVIKKRWEEGERDKQRLGACPTKRDEIGCFECQYEAFPDEGDQETG